MATELGKYLKHLRIDREERLLDMAKSLDVSSAFLSAVERGKKAPPSNLLEKVAARYELAGVKLQELRQAIDRSITAFKLCPDDGVLSQDTAALLARKFNSLSDDQLKGIQKILHKGEKNGDRT